EPLSTTTTSLPATRSAAATTDGRYFSRRSRPFQLGITTAAEDASGGVSVFSLRRGSKRTTRSTKARLIAANSSRSGERMASGSPVKMRRKAPGLAAATVCITLGWRLVEIRSQVQFAADLNPARRSPQVEARAEVLHLH